MNKKVHKLGLKRTSIIMAVLTAVFSLFLFTLSFRVYSISNRLQESSNEYISSQLAASRLKQGSDNFMKYVRSYVVTGDEAYLKYYQTEHDVTRTYELAYNELLPYITTPYLENTFNNITKYQDMLFSLDALSIQLTMDVYGVEDETYLEMFDEKDYLSDFYKNLTPEQKNKYAIETAFGFGNRPQAEGSYEMDKRIIDDNIESLLKQLASEAQKKQDEDMQLMKLSMQLLRIDSMILLFIVLIDVFFIIKYVVRPLVSNANHINNDEFLDEQGVAEIRTLAISYNDMYAKVKEDNRKLSYEASHDSLTDLYNRQAYYDLKNSNLLTNICLLHIDVDDFKSINDTYGHDVGDKVLKKISETLKCLFRSGDLIYRLGGDEFVVIMIEVGNNYHEIIEEKKNSLYKIMQDDSDGVPKITLSIGASYVQGLADIDSTYKQADKALYKAKAEGKNTIVFYEDI